MNSKSYFNLSALHLFVILTCTLMQMLNLGEPYRFFAYSNLVIVLIVFFRNFNKFESVKFKYLPYLLFVPLGFIALHFVAVMGFEYTREMRRIILATFFMIGIWMLALEGNLNLQGSVLKFILLILITYTATQVISLWIFQRPYGTTNNPHYLAFYSAISLIFSIYAFFKVSKLFRLLIISIILSLGVFLIHTHSRPTWIALIVAGLLSLLFFEPKIRKLAALVMILVLLGLSLINVGNFASRFSELFMHLKTEERVMIWKDTWNMQTDSSLSQWLFGHGLNTFEPQFKLYSHYHLLNIDFNSPHNFILELLFTSGVLGVLLGMIVISYICKYIFLLMNSQKENRTVALLLLTVFTANLITVCITVPFFSGYNLNTMAAIAGALLYIHQIHSKQA